jgi:hypothetical protein
MSTSKKMLLKSKIVNFVNYLEGKGANTDKMQQIKALSVERILNLYVSNATKFSDIDKAAMELIDNLDIIRTDEVVKTVTLYLVMFIELMNI